MRRARVRRGGAARDGRRRGRTLPLAVGDVPLSAARHGDVLLRRAGAARGYGAGAALFGDVKSTSGRRRCSPAFKVTVTVLRAPRGSFSTVSTCLPGRNPTPSSGVVPTRR